MKELTFTSKITVTLIQQMGGDHMIAAAAKVSTTGAEAQALADPSNTDDVSGLINYLVKNRHGSPFEHSAITLFVHAPIFLWREWHRHRIGFSYNEESARYKTLDPVFYVPESTRPMFKVEGWKPGRPKFLNISQELDRVLATKTSEEWERHGPMTEKQSASSRFNRLCGGLKHSYKVAYETYLDNLEMGFDPGLARDCLPVGIYSSCWVTCNPRSLMAFLSLRVQSEDSKFPSYPLYEIDIAAQQAEAILKEYWPLTHAAFIANGRVAP